MCRFRFVLIIIPCGRVFHNEGVGEEFYIGTDREKLFKILFSKSETSIVAKCLTLENVEKSFKIFINKTYATKLSKYFLFDTIKIV